MKGLKLDYNAMQTELKARIDADAQTDYLDIVQSAVVYSMEVATEAIVGLTDEEVFAEYFLFWIQYPTREDMLTARAETMARTVMRFSTEGEDGEDAGREELAAIVAQHLEYEYRGI